MNTIHGNMLALFALSVLSLALLMVLAGAVALLVLLDAIVMSITKQRSFRKRFNLYHVMLLHLIRNRRQLGSYIIDPGPDWTHVQIIRYPKTESPEEPTP